MPLLSFSIDLSRSTEVKSLINKIAGNNPTHKENLMSGYAANEMLLLEPVWQQGIKKGKFTFIAFC